jgi:hypothetical protein
LKQFGDGLKEVLGLPTRENITSNMPKDEPIDLGHKQKGKRERFNAFAENIYSTMDDAINFLFPHIEPELKEELMFSALEKNRINNFIFLILKRWFPKVLDSLIADEFSIGGDDASIVNIIFAGALCIFVILKKVRVISKLVKKDEEKFELPPGRDESAQ